MRYDARMEDGDDDMLSLQQAAERIGVGAHTLSQQAKKGVLRAVLIGHSYVVTASELDRYRREHRGRQGFAARTHPLHGKRGGGGRPKKGETPPA